MNDSGTRLATACPSCGQPMNEKRFERVLQGEVVLDLCFSCRGIWFDEFESAQMTPGAVLDLFKAIHDENDAPPSPMREPLRCPRCAERLLHGVDVAKFGGPFNYYRCLQKHGRYTAFSQFMIEKGFVRQLSGAEIAALAARVQIVRCSGCGAPVDIRKESACSHCRAPIAILDPQAVQAATSRLEAAEVQRTTRDVEALGDAIIMRAREASRHQRERGREERSSAGITDTIDLISAGVELVWDLLRRGK